MFGGGNGFPQGPPSWSESARALLRRGERPESENLLGRRGSNSSACKSWREKRIDGIRSTLEKKNQLGEVKGNTPDLTKRSMGRA